jgi:hypothetical protein
MKKNTLLYLDENLVRTAKQAGFNLSEITEAALRKRLLPLLSSGDRLGMELMDPDKFFTDLKEAGQCWELPFELGGIELKNVGPIGELDAEFKRGINVIVGPNASGKSIMVRVMALVFGQRPKYVDEKMLLKHGEREGKIKIRLMKRASVELVLKKTANGPKACLLLDDPYSVAVAHAEYKRKFLTWLKGKANQVILTSRDESFVTPDVSNVIRLPPARP